MMFGLHLSVFASLTTFNTLYRNTLSLSENKYFSFTHVCVGVCVCTCVEHKVCCGLKAEIEFGSIPFLRVNGARTFM